MKKKASLKSKLEDSENSNPIFMFPEEILVKIFQYVVIEEGAVPFLSRAAKISSTWQRAAHNPSLWKTVDLSGVSVKKSQNTLLSLGAVHILKNIEELILSGWGVGLTTNGIKLIAESCTRMTSINLSGCKRLNFDSLKLLVDNCKRIKNLDLSHMNTSIVCTNSIKYLTSQLGSSLTSLNVSRNKGSFNSILTCITENCPNLQVLDASNWNSGCLNTVPINVEKLQMDCPDLCVLRLANTPFTLASVPFAESCKSLGFQKLEELSMGLITGFYSYMNDESLQRILKSSCKLRLLDIRGMPHITTSGLVRIPASDLQHLFLSHCAGVMDDQLELLMQKWQYSLKEVDMSWNTQDSVNQAVAALASKPCEKSNLHVLQLSGTNIKFASIKLVLENCSKIDYLNLNSCRALPRGMKRVYQNDDLSKLRDAIISEKFPY